MPTKLTVLDSDTGLTSEHWGVTAREMVANDPARFSIVDDSEEVTARNGSGIREASHTVLDSRSRRS